MLILFLVGFVVLVLLGNAVENTLGDK